jgi:cell division protein ZapA (FtsZ GTPase activity inhibitor)
LIGSPVGDRHTVQVTIFHQTYNLRTSGDESEIVQLADSVDQLMSNIAARSANADSLREAVLACLHMADRLRTLESRSGKRWDGLVSQIISVVVAAVIGGFIGHFIQ